MKRMKKILMTLAAAMVTVTMVTACAAEEDNAVVSSEDKPQTVTQTIHLTLGNDATRAVTADGVKTWSEDEYVAVLFELENYDESGPKYTSVTGQLSNVSEDGKSADLTVTFSNMSGTLKSDGKFLLVYPSTACNLYADDGLDPDLLKTQDGTLAKLSSTKDLAVGSGTLNGTYLPAGATITMKNPNCIMKLSLTDSSGINDLTAKTTSLVVGDGTNTYTITRTEAAEPIYIAMKPVTAGKFTFVAKTSDGSYWKTVASATLQAGKIYTSKISTSSFPYKVGRVLGSDGQVYGNKNDVSEGYTATGMIAYVGPETGVDGHATPASMLVFSLNNTTQIYSGAETWAKNSTSLAARPNGASTWAIPTIAQWMRMMEACGGSTYTSPRYDASFKYGNLATKMSACGSDFSINSGVKYWTSSAGSSADEMAVYNPYDNTFTSYSKYSQLRLHVVCVYTPSE